MKRTVLDTQPITVQYQLTEHGLSLSTSSIFLKLGIEA
ncbi:hypothetical protein [Algoriphagus iocasae]